MNYKGKSVLLASKHHKEQAIEPVFRQRIACNLYVADIDTDQFGTFTGEIPRTSSAYETCILKAKYAAKEKQCALSIASEGSFGPHPSNPFIPHAHEIMVFVDLEHDWIIAEHLTTPKTNYKMMTIHQKSALEPFLESVLFPSHALTLQSSNRLELIGKGITTHQQLNTALSTGFKKHQELCLATDMRAMMNPTRMQSLAELAEKLVTRIQSICPGCGVPGFGFKSVSGHLPCTLCEEETNLYRFEEWGCIQCDYQEPRPRKDNLTVASPTYCNYCNP